MEWINNGVITLTLSSLRRWFPGEILLPLEDGFPVKPFYTFQINLSMCGCIQTIILNLIFKIEGLLLGLVQEIASAWALFKQSVSSLGIEQPILRLYIRSSAIVHQDAHLEHSLSYEFSYSLTFNLTLLRLLFGLLLGLVQEIFSLLLGFIQAFNSLYFQGSYLEYNPQSSILPFSKVEGPSLGPRTSILGFLLGPAQETHNMFS